MKKITAVALNYYCTEMIQSIFLDSKRYMLLKQDYISDIQEFRTNKFACGRIRRDQNTVGRFRGSGGG